MDPILVARQLRRLDEWLRPDFLKHVPVAVRLATRVVHRIGAKIVDRCAVVISLREVRRTDVETRNRSGPFRQRGLVPCSGNLDGSRQCGRDRRANRKQPENARSNDVRGIPPLN
jgi:hypothetical protein